MNQADLINAIYREQDRAVDYANTQLREIRKKAWNRVLHRYRGDETTTKSTVQATTIRDQGYALLAAIMPAYNTDRLISFPANGPQDADQADAEAAAVDPGPLGGDELAQLVDEHEQSEGEQERCDAEQHELDVSFLVCGLRPPVAGPG